MEFVYYCMSPERLKDFTSFLFGQEEFNKPLSLNTSRTEKLVVSVEIVSSTVLVYNTERKVLYSSIKLDEYLKKYNETLIPGSRQEIIAIS